MHNLMEMKEICKENNCTLLFIWHCWLLDGKLKRHKEYKPETPYLDICNIYHLQKQNSDIFFADYCHPSAKGHKIIAEEIAKKIVGEIGI